MAIKYGGFSKINPDSQKFDKLVKLRVINSTNCKIEFYRRKA